MPAYNLKTFGNATFNETSKTGTCMNGCQATNEGYLPVEYQGEGYRHIKRNLTEAQYVMTSFGPEQLPVTNALVENFAVFDRWWAAFPGPSWPNHLFSITGTSGGCTETGDYYQCSYQDGKIFPHGPPKNKSGAKLFPMPTIFDSVQEAGHDWMMIYNDSRHETCANAHSSPPVPMPN